ncbi:hypothetical protein RHGRI_011997 [Rhododendron griersonianum]|uniref:Glutathione S-transferase n=1 Tax=Rhododendron griersonianum TaxID=479676 RepID=A0AAV6KPF8_9ERIC|nr:hypothetical protein RHGRI_011997 [Rhododendron griersonianum]
MESKEAVKLLGFWVSPFSFRVEWALRLKGVEYEYIEEDVFNKSPLLLELNPVHKKVPVLIHGDKFWINAWTALCTEGEDREMYIKQAVESLEKIEQELIRGKSKFFGGESIGYLDIALGWISYWLPNWEEIGSMKILDPTRFPATAGWTENFRNHPVVKDKLPPRDKMFVYNQWQSKEIGAQMASARKG